MILREWELASGSLSAAITELERRKYLCACVLEGAKAQTVLVMDNGWTEETGDQSVRYEGLALSILTDLYESNLRGNLLTKLPARKRKIR